jgi:hypothetical protein
VTFVPTAATKTYLEASANMYITWENPVTNPAHCAATYTYVLDDADADDDSTPFGVESPLTAGDATLYYS